MRNRKVVYTLAEQDYVYERIEKIALRKKKAVRFNDEFYSTLRYTYDGMKFGEILKFAGTNGNCYFYALLLSRAMPGSTLKIGNLNRLNQSVEDCYFIEFGHSWVEYGSKVYDTTSKMIYDKNFYYKNFIAEEKESYEHSELCNDVKFFGLALNSVRYRDRLLKSYKDYTQQIYDQNKEDCDKIIEEFHYSSEFSINKQDIENLFKE